MVSFWRMEKDGCDSVYAKETVNRLRRIDERMKILSKEWSLRFGATVESLEPRCCVSVTSSS